MPFKGVVVFCTLLLMTSVMIARNANQLAHMLPLTRALHAPKG